MTNIQTGDRGQRYEVTFYSSSEGEWTQDTYLSNWTNK